MSKQETTDNKINQTKKGKRVSDKQHMSKQQRTSKTQQTTINKQQIKSSKHMNNDNCSTNSYVINKDDDTRGKNNNRTMRI